MMCGPRQKAHGARFKVNGKNLKCFPFRPPFAKGNEGGLLISFNKSPQPPINVKLHLPKTYFQRLTLNH